MPISIGVLGLASFYGPAYAERAAQRVDCDVVAASTLGLDDDSLSSLSRPTSDQFAEEYDCHIFEDAEPVLEEADAVVVASPTSRRATDTCRALERGIPVLCAKPAAKGYADARRIAETTGSDVPLIFTTPARYDDAIIELADRVENGGVGDVIAVRADIRHDRTPESGINHNAEHAPDEAGAAYAMAMYTADVLLWLTPDHPERVSAEYVNANTPYSSHPDLGTATIRFRDGVLGTMTMTYSTDCREAWGNWEVEVVGTDGIIRTAHQGYEGLHWVGGELEERKTTTFGRTTSPVLDRTFDAFVQSIRGDRPVRSPSPNHVVTALGLCEAWLAAAEGEPLTFEEWPPTMEALKGST